MAGSGRKRGKPGAEPRAGESVILLLTRKTLAEGTKILRERDPRLGAWIDRVGKVDLRRQRHRFGALCRSIISQQLGAGAARSIHRRFLALFATGSLRRGRPSPSPEKLLHLRAETLRRCGISGRKIHYLRALAREFREGSLAGVPLSPLGDSEVIRRLTELPGIGRWTAEMFLIFSLGRLDVFSAGDLALVEGVRRVEGRGLTAAEAAEAAQRWAPYRSVASLYLWKVAHWKDGAGPEAKESAGAEVPNRRRG